MVRVKVPSPGFHNETAHLICNRCRCRRSTIRNFRKHYRQLNNKAENAGRARESNMPYQSSIETFAEAFLYEQTQQIVIWMNVLALDILSLLIMGAR